MKKPQSRDLRGALAGILAAAGGVGASMLLAALLGSVSSPVYALGTTVIGITPGWLKDFAVEKFGTDDKTILLASVFVVMALASAVVGIVASRRLRLGLILAAVLNLVALGGAIKTLNGLDFSVGTILPGLLSLVVSVALLWFFGRSWGSDLTENDKPSGFNRRVFLEAALASGGVAVVAGGTSTLFGKAGASSRDDVKLPAAATKAKTLPQGTDLDVKGITSYLTSNDKFYRVDVALKVPQIDAASWRLKIHGMVDKEIELSYDDILKMPLVERRITLTCVSNQVGDHYVGNATWLGVPMRELLKQAGVKSGADCLVSTSDDDMTISTPIEALTDDRDALLAVGMNGEPLPLKHGFPARMVVPGLYGYVSATKWVVDMEVSRFSDVSTYWTDRKWAEKAPIKTESRIDVPRQFASVKPGKVNVAGVAYAQRRGIEKVEVRVDQGDWQEARLATEDTIDNWRQWVFPWDATQGQHKIYVRATDKTGYTQTSDRVPPRPDGATGWHSTTVNVQ
jgi:DMSO/TMAO reductase YedYZ molybdopterin-dependent catalytic subunit